MVYDFSTVLIQSRTLSLADVRGQAGNHGRIKCAPPSIATKSFWNNNFIHTHPSVFKMPTELEDLVGFINHGSTPVRQLGMCIPWCLIRRR